VWCWFSVQFIFLRTWLGCFDSCFDHSHFLCRSLTAACLLAPGGDNIVSNNLYRILYTDVYKARYQISRPSSSEKPEILCYSDLVNSLLIRPSMYILRVSEFRLHMNSLSYTLSYTLFHATFFMNIVSQPSQTHCEPLQTPHFPRLLIWHSKKRSVLKKLTE